jgi:hypothetical protein
MESSTTKYRIQHFLAAIAVVLCVTGPLFPQQGRQSKRQKMQLPYITPTLANMKYDLHKRNWVMAGDVGQRTKTTADSVVFPGIDWEETVPEAQGAGPAESPRASHSICAGRDRQASRQRLGRQ